MQIFARKLKITKMNKQSLNKPALRAIFAPVAAALVSTVFVFSPSRRRPYMPRAWFVILLLALRWYNAQKSHSPPTQNPIYC